MHAAAEIESRPPSGPLLSRLGGQLARPEPLGTATAPVAPAGSLPAPAPAHPAVTWPVVGRRLDFTSVAEIMPWCGRPASRRLHLRQVRGIVPASYAAAVPEWRSAPVAEPMSAAGDAPADARRPLGRRIVRGVLWVVRAALRLPDLELPDEHRGGPFARVASRISDALVAAMAAVAISIVVVPLLQTRAATLTPGHTPPSHSAPYTTSGPDAPGATGSGGTSAGTGPGSTGAPPAAPDPGTP